MTTFELSLRRITPDRLHELAHAPTTLSLSASDMEQVRAARKLIEEAVEKRTPVYGVTTGLGSRAKEALPEELLSAFSVETLNGRAQSLGPALPRPLVRAAMIIRLLTFLSGRSGVSPKVAEHLCDVLNAGLVPAVGRYGSIGASDLLLGAEMGRAVMGIGGELVDAKGVSAPSSDALRAAGLEAPDLGPRDGLALANHGCFTTAAATLAWKGMRRVGTASMKVVALSMLGFQSNLSPLANTLEGNDNYISRQLEKLLEGQTLTPRFLQDPISFRNAVQPLSCSNHSFGELGNAVKNELLTGDDNPAVDLHKGEISSTGNYFKLNLALRCNAAAQALAVCGVASVARTSKLCNSTHSGLPDYLADPEVGTNGFAPLLKLAESLLAELQQEATPPVISPSINANGVEDVPTHSFQSAMQLDEAVGRLSQIVALEAIVAAQACDLRGIEVHGDLHTAYALTRKHSPYLRESRPLGAEIEALANAFRAPEQFGETHD